MRPALHREAAQHRAPQPPGAHVPPAVQAWWHEWGLLAATLVWLAATAWARPLALPDEGRYVGVAWSMLTSGDWVVPRLDGLPYFHKPPLFYWLTAASLAVLGHGEGAARAAPMLGAWAGTVAAYLFARRWWGHEAARATLLVFATQPLAFMGAQFANLDMLVAGCIAVTVLAFAHAALEAGEGLRASHGVLAAGHAFAALGVLAKGLIGGVLPGVVLLAWIAVRGPGQRMRALRSMLWWPGIVLFAAIAVPWFVAMQLRHPTFAHYFFVVQHFSRYAQGGFNNAQPAWFYVAAIALLCLPWSAWLAWRRAPGPGDVQTAPLRQLMWLWLALITLFFSIPQSKLVGYILPVTWPLAMLVAQRAAPWAGGTRRTLWRASLALGAAACLAAVVATAVHPGRSTRELGQALAARLQPGEAVAFLHEAYFDLPYYARLHEPVRVVDDWHDPQIATHDNWRKELADAGRFAPDRAGALLLTPERFVAQACAGALRWVVGHRASAAAYPLLRSADAVAEVHDTVLWRLPAGVSRATACRETPSTN